MVPAGVLETVLYAKDLASAEAFYRDALGMQPFARMRRTVPISQVGVPPVVVVEKLQGALQRRVVRLHRRGRKVHAASCCVIGQSAVPRV